MAKRKRPRYILITVLVLVAGTAIYFLLNKEEALKFVLPEIEKITLIEADIHSDTAFVQVHAVVRNKAPYAINVDSIVCDVSLGGTKLLSEREYVGLRQKSHQADTVTFSVRIPISHTRKTIRHLQGKDTTGLALHATIVYSVRRLNLSRNKEIEVPVPPRLRIVRTERKEVHPFKRDLKADLYLEILNDGKNLDLTIHDLRYALHIGQDLDTKGKFGKNIIIKPHSGLLLKFPLDFYMEHPIGTILKVWTDTDRVPYTLRLDGYIDAGDLKRIPIVLHASGKLEIVNEQKNKAEHRKNN